MHEDRIQSQIDGVSTRRFLGSILKFSAAVFVVAFAYGYVVKHSYDPATKALATFGLSAVLFGFVASGLAPSSRRLLNLAFVVVPIVATALLFVLRTLFGYTDQLPLRLVLTPLAFTLGFILGQLRLPRS